MLQVKTSWGCIEVVTSAGRIAACTLPFLQEPPAGPLNIISRRRDAVTHFIAGMLTGEPVDAPPLLPPAGTDFQQQVWRVIAGIPAGRTLTYTQLAAATGRPRAVRAAAGACGRNPLPLFIPCHRVVAAGGGLGGFSAGPPWKAHLLAIESTRHASRLLPQG